MGGVAKTVVSMAVGALIMMGLIFLWKKALVGKNIPVVSTIAEQV